MPAYTYTPTIWLPLINAVFLAATAVYCWRRRAVPAALPLFANYLVSIIFLLAGMLQTAAVDPATKVFWYKFQAAVLAFGPATLTCFILEFVYPGRWVTRRNVALLLAPALLYVILIAIGGSRAVWRQVAVAPDGTILTEPTAAVLLMNSYAAVLTVIDGVALAWLFVRSPVHRWPIGLLFFPVLVVRVPFVFSLLDLDLPVQLDLVAVGRLLTYLAGVVALFGFRIFDPLPAAREAVIDQMHEGVVVFDPGWRILKLNPVAEAILGVRHGAARGMPWQAGARLAGPRFRSVRRDARRAPRRRQATRYGLRAWRRGAVVRAGAFRPHGLSRPSLRTPARPPRRDRTETGAGAVAGAALGAGDAAGAHATGARATRWALAKPRVP